jgi:hypothetical protein
MGAKTATERANNTRNILMAIPEISFQKAEALNLAYGSLPAPTVSAIGEAIHVPHAKKDKPWRNAMRAFVFVKLLINQLGNNPTTDIKTLGRDLRKQNENNNANALRTLAKDAVGDMKFGKLSALTFPQTVLRALHKVVKHYGGHIPEKSRLTQPFQGTSMDTTVRVVVDTEWAKYYLINSNKANEDASTIAGVTGAKSYNDPNWPRAICLHGGLYTFGTIVHELLHFTCHDNFWSAFGELDRKQANERKLDEGITEYFTRKIVGEESRKMNYPIEFREVHDYVNHETFSHDELLAAYFAGDEQAIEKVTGVLKGLTKAQKKMQRRGIGQY